MELSQLSPPLLCSLSIPSSAPRPVHKGNSSTSSTRPALNYSVAAFSSELGAKNTLKGKPWGGSFHRFILLLPPPSPAISPQPSWPFYPGGNVVLIPLLYKGRGNTAPFILSLHSLISVPASPLMEGGF